MASGTNVWNLLVSTNPLNVRERTRSRFQMVKSTLKVPTSPPTVVPGRIIHGSDARCFWVISSPLMSLSESFCSAESL